MGQLKKNKNIRQKISSELLGQGILKQHIQDSKFSSTPEYGFFGDKPNRYTVNNIVSIDISDAQELEIAASIVDKFENVFFMGTQFIHSEQQKFKIAVLRRAIKQALRKKKLYEKTLEIELGLVNIIEHSSAMTEQRPLSRAKSSSANSYQSSSQSFGELTYAATVELVLEKQ